MKKYFLSIALMVATITSGSVAATSSVSYEWSNYTEERSNRSISIQVMSEELIFEVIKGKHTDIAVKCTAGTSVPLNLFFKR